MFTHTWLDHYLISHIDSASVKKYCEMDYVEWPLLFPMSNSIEKKTWATCEVIPSLFYFHLDSKFYLYQDYILFPLPRVLIGCFALSCSKRFFHFLSLIKHQISIHIKLITVNCSQRNPKKDLVCILKKGRRLRNPIIFNTILF